MVGKMIKAMIAMGVSLGIVGLLFTIYCNVQLKTANARDICRSYREDQRSGLCDRARVPCIQKWETIVCTRRPLKWCIKIISGKESTKIILSGAARENKTGKNIFDKM